MLDRGLAALDDEYMKAGGSFLILVTRLFFRVLGIVLYPVPQVRFTLWYWSEGPKGDVDWAPVVGVMSFIALLGIASGAMLVAAIQRGDARIMVIGSIVYLVGLWLHLRFKKDAEQMRQ